MFFFLYQWEASSWDHLIDPLSRPLPHPLCWPTAAEEQLFETAALGGRPLSCSRSAPAPGCPQPLALGTRSKLGPSLVSHPGTGEGASGEQAVLPPWAMSSLLWQWGVLPPQGTLMAPHPTDPRGLEGQIDPGACPTRWVLCCCQPGVLDLVCTEPPGSWERSGVGRREWARAAFQNVGLRSLRDLPQSCGPESHRLSWVFVSVLLGCGTT